MSILEYFTRKQAGTLPNPEGTLSNLIPGVAIESANSEVRKVFSQQTSPQSQVSRKKSRKGRKPRSYSPREQAEIGKLACTIGATAAARRISKKVGVIINQSTVRGIKKAYLAELRFKRLREEEDLSIEELLLKKRGRPLLLGNK